MSRSAALVSRARVRRSLAALLVLTAAVEAAPARRAAAGDDPARLLPEHCAVYAEAPGLGRLAAEGLEHPFVAALLATELAAELLGGASPEGLLALADAALGLPVLATAADLTAGGLALGLVPAEPEPRFALVALGADEERARAALGRILGRVADAVGATGAFERPGRQEQGADVWSLDQARIARRGALVVATNDESLLQEVLANAADSARPGLAGRPELRAARGDRAGTELVWAWADLASLEASGEKARGGLAKLRALPSDPNAQFLLGPGITALGTAERVTAWLSPSSPGARGLVAGVRGEGLHAPAGLDPRTSERAAGAAPWTPPDTACAAASVHRDLAAVFARRAELFPAERLPGFAKAIGDLAPIFGGRDIGADVAPSVAPRLALVVAPVEFEEGRTPAIPLPAAALVARLEREGEGEELTAAFQTLLAITNVESAQQGRRPFRLTLGLEGATQVVSGRMLPPPSDGGVDVRYNLQPACAAVGDRFVLGTHEDLVRRIVRDLQAGRAGGGDEAAGERLVVRGPALAPFLEANREAIVMNKMLEDGVSREAAEREERRFRLALEAVERAELEVRYEPDGAVRIELTATLAGD